MNWHSIERPGYLGKHRDERHQEWTRLYRAANWRLAWQIGGHYFEIEAAIALYEDAYFNFMGSSPVTEELIRVACDVYDDSPSNIKCGLSYFPQETNRTHLQDVAIRRALVRLGRWFEGEALIQIRDDRGEHPLSLTLSPGRVPFHRPDLMIQPELAGWWQPGSVESFYQSNRWLQVKTSN
ncbi:MAG TPA: hypothetical protein VLE72_01460 [Candidatus Saccharimonadales bacterium]|nr:hypothetical protein [Candidatus Saccharimonadales bacterium]